MEISIRLNNVSKKYINEWIFRNLSYTIKPFEKLVILGSNGSGKSTLLQTVASYLIPTKGEVIWETANERIADEEIYKKLSVASPYMELIEDFTLTEAVEHQKEFKPFVNQMSSKEVISVMELESSSDKFIRNFSSGMRQRAKLGLAILADCPVLLLDEPCTNLDARAIVWYKQMIAQYGMHKTVLVCSNTVTDEYSFCTTSLEIEKFKK